MSTDTTKQAWKHREKAARLLAQAVAQQRQIKERLLRYRAENARPEDAKGVLPQEVAAWNAKVSARQWQRWESGERLPHQSNLEKLAENLDIPIAEFFTAAPTTDATPNLLGTMNGDVPQELQAQLARIEDKLDAILTRMDLAATTPQTTAPATPQEAQTKPTAKTSKRARAQGQ